MPQLCPAGSQCLVLTLKAASTKPTESEYRLNLMIAGLSWYGDLHPFYGLNRRGKWHFHIS